MLAVNAENMRVAIDYSGNVTLSMDVCNESRNALKKAFPNLRDKKLRLDIVQWRNKRSLDANAYFWVLCSKIAEVLLRDKEDMYLELLDKYGVFTHVIVKPEVVSRMKQEWRLIKELGEVTVNGKTGMQLQCFFGSSTYDSKEMARLIDGAIQTAEELNIPTLPDADIRKMKEEWGAEKQKD